MQTKKMSLASIQGKMSRSEMKGIMAGSTWHCGCAHHVGGWTYTTTPTTAQRGADIARYCRGGGACILTNP
jgi:hypothetical protein